MLLSYRHKTLPTNEGLLLHAVHHGGLFIDAANCANPYKLMGLVDEADLERVFVMNAEAIYRFRDTIKEARGWLEQKDCTRLYVSTVGALFSYDDAYENTQVLGHCYALLAKLAEDYEVIVAKDRRYGHLLPSHQELQDNGTYGYQSKASFRTDYAGTH